MMQCSLRIKTLSFHCLMVLLLLYFVRLCYYIHYLQYIHRYRTNTSISLVVGWIPTTLSLLLSWITTQRREIRFQNEILVSLHRLLYSTEDNALVIQRDRWTRPSMNSYYPGITIIIVWIEYQLSSKELSIIYILYSIFYIIIGWLSFLYLLFNWTGPHTIPTTTLHISSLVINFL